MGEGATVGGTTREDILPLVPQLRAYARSLTAGDSHAADDLVQDTMVLALQAWDRFTPGTNLKAWLFRILHNRFHSVISRRHVRAEIGVDDLAPLASVPAVQEARVELPTFKRAFAHLPATHREALVIHAVHGMSLEQIAAISGCKVQAVKSRMNRARTSLRRMLLGERPINGHDAARPARAPTKPAPTPPTPPILIRRAPAPVIPARRRPWLAEAERRIAEVESQVTRHRSVVESLGRLGLATAGAEVALRLAERRLAHLRVHRTQLLNGRLKPPALGAP